MHSAVGLHNHQKTVFSLTQPHGIHKTTPGGFTSMIKESGGAATFGQKELQNVLP